ncbi:MAG: hypothetical protein E7665_03985 [Ruminococcaceae bacterium]|nr:hypothetical protein [Oscillospiraceae bacterium]
MKKKHILAMLLITGIILMCSGVILAFARTNAKDIIGGADIHTFLFVFFNGNGGTYFYLTLSGLIELIVLSILRRISK